MKFLLVLVLLAASGCTAPEVRERDRQVEAMVRAKYDLPALLIFLKKTVAEHPTFDGMTLSDRVTESWRRVEGDSSYRLMRSGDWVLEEQPSRPADRFELHYVKGKSFIAIEAKRLAKDSFELVQISRGDVLQLVDYWPQNR